MFKKPVIEHGVKSLSVCVGTKYVGKEYLRLL